LQDWLKDQVEGQRGIELMHRIGKPSSAAATATRDVRATALAVHTFFAARLPPSMTLKQVKTRSL
jgi:hypothetical protein